MVDTNKQLFFALLRDALWRQEECIPAGVSEEDTEKLFQDATEQTVKALVIDALVRHEVKVPRPLVLRMIGLQNQVEQNNHQLNDRLKDFVMLMETNDVDYRVVKGQTVAAFYPNALLRQCGDIDYYCNAENFEKSVQVLKNAWHVNPDQEDSDHHMEFYHRDVLFEGHYSLGLFHNKQKDEYWERILREDEDYQVNVGEVKVKTLSPTLHTLYIFLHLYHHLMELGIGLRQFCDWAVLLHACHDEINQEQLRYHLQQLGVENAYRACGCVLTDYLGLPAKDFTYQLTEKDRRYTTKILNIVFYRGNMGKYNKKSTTMGWKHNIEATAIKWSHFYKFMPLAPDYSWRWISYEMKRKIASKMRRG